MSVGAGWQFVDLGAGDCCKAELAAVSGAESRYVAVDIAGDGARAPLARMAPEFPELRLHRHRRRFHATVWICRTTLGDQPALFFYPGSVDRQLLAGRRASFCSLTFIDIAIAAPGSGLLIGVDTRKDPWRVSLARTTMRSA